MKLDQISALDFSNVVDHFCRETGQGTLLCCGVFTAGLMSTATVFSGSIFSDLQYVWYFSVQLGDSCQLVRIQG